MQNRGPGRLEAQRGAVIRYSFVRVAEQRVAAVLVDRRDLIASRSSSLIEQLEEMLPCPVMLVARDETDWAGARMYAHFYADPFFYALLQTRDIEWIELQPAELTTME